MKRSAFCPAISPLLPLRSPVARLLLTGSPSERINCFWDLTFYLHPMKTPYHTSPFSLTEFSKRPGTTLRLTAWLWRAALVLAVGLGLAPTPARAQNPGVGGTQAGFEIDAHFSSGIIPSFWTGSGANQNYFPGVTTFGGGPADLTVGEITFDELGRQSFEIVHRGNLLLLLVEPAWFGGGGEAGHRTSLVVGAEHPATWTWPGARERGTSVRRRPRRVRCARG